MGLERNVGLIVELLEKQEQRATPVKRSPSKFAVQAKQLPRRYAVPLCIAGAVVATTVGITQCSPRLSEDQVAEQATLAAVGQVAPYVDAQLANNRAEATTVVVQDPLSVYGLELTEDAKTAIGWVGSEGNMYLNPARAEYVAKQVRVLSASVRLLDLRLTSTGPSDLKVHTNVAEGFALFAPPAAAAPTTPTTAAATATSAP